MSNHCSAYLKDRLIISVMASVELLSSFSKVSAECIERLVAYLSATKSRKTLESPPQSRRASVFVLLFQQDGHIRVLLTTRSRKLKFHGGETALPGGMRDAGDLDFIHTARREAFEEVALPLFSSHIHTLGSLDPFMFYNITVTPVIAVLTDNALILDLRPRPAEVEYIFTRPLEAFLDPNLASTLESNLVDQGSEHWPFESESHCFQDYTIKQLGSTLYRYHQFRSSASPITGLTADILLEMATIVYGRTTNFERWAPTQLRTYEEIIESRSSDESA